MDYLKEFVKPKHLLLLLVLILILILGWHGVHFDHGHDTFLNEGIPGQIHGDTIPLLTTLLFSIFLLFIATIFRITLKILLVLRQFLWSSVRIEFNFSRFFSPISTALRRGILHTKIYE